MLYHAPVVRYFEIFSRTRCTGDEEDGRLIDIDFFLLVFDNDQRAMPGTPTSSIRPRTLVD
jgi:hypothetical protein